MSPKCHLEVIQGPEKGKCLRIPPQGGRLGRSSQNDLCLMDPVLSRNHCHFAFRAQDGLWLTDLASANQTEVNGKAITSCRVFPGDVIQAGESLIRVIQDQPDPESSPFPGTARSDNPDATVLDLGLPENDFPSHPGSSRHFRPLMIAIAAIALFVALLLSLLFRSGEHPQKTPIQPAPVASPDSVRIAYEKVEADGDNIFRYAMILAEDQMLSVQIDSLSENRHVRKSQMVAADLIRSLAENVVAAGIFSLEPRYEGLGTGNSLSYWDIEFIVNNRAHRSVVRDRPEPEGFRRIRELLETFGKNELGLWAIQFSIEKLQEMAYDALVLARNRFDARDVEHGNLFKAIQGYREAEFFLETVEPKPDYFADILTEMREANETLNQRYEIHRLQADRASNLSDWQSAARELRILLDLIPDRNDNRHQEVYRKLLDVENRLRRSR